MKSDAESIFQKFKKIATDVEILLKSYNHFYGISHYNYRLGMKYLYKNEDGFAVERKLGHTGYYCDILKSAIEKYALSEKPDYDELDKIVKRIDIYMESSRYLGELGAPIYCTSGFASDVMLVRTALLKMDRKTMSKERIQSFYKIQIKKIDKAKEDYKSSLWTS